MIPLHPPLSGFPLSCGALLVCVELFCLFRGSPERLESVRKFLVFSSLASTLATFLSGYQASAPLRELAPDIANTLGSHHAFGRLLLINSIALAVFYLVSSRAVYGKTVMRAFYALTVMLQFALAIISGGLGGSLVFEHGVGVMSEPRLSTVAEQVASFHQAPTNTP